MSFKLKVFWFAAIPLCPSVIVGQGFGAFKKTLVLNRDLPAAVQLPGNSFDVKVSTQNQQYAVIVDKLLSTIQTQLIRYNSSLILTPDRPDATVTVRVLNYNVRITPEADPLAMSLHSKKSSGQTGQTGQSKSSANRVTADLSVTYMTRARTGASVDAEPIDVKFSALFDTASETVSKTKEIIGRIPHPGRHKPAAEDDTPHTVGDVEQLLVNRLAERVAARLVNTHERVEVQLARGKLDETNRYAEAGQWTKFVEELETMPPFPDTVDDSYRIYNVGVGDEALGYKAETPASAKRYFEQAVVRYRSASDANPHEQYFLEPINRIEVALEHYKKLASTAPARKTTGK